MAPPPPMPLIHGSSVPSAKVVAIMASTQSPPAASTAAPTSAARRDCAATMPPLEETAGLRSCWELENWSSMSFLVRFLLRCRAPLRREAHRQLADSMHEIVRGDINAAGVFDVRQPRQQLPVDFLELQLRDPLADADMRPEAEGDVLRRVRPADVELVGIGEYRGIAVGRGKIHDHLLALGDPLAADLGI